LPVLLVAIREIQERARGRVETLALGQLGARLPETTRIEKRPALREELFGSRRSTARRRCWRLRVRGHGD